MTDLKKAAAQQALEALEELNGWQSLAPPLASQAGRQAAINLRATLEQKPKFTLSCGCPSQYAGVPAEWPVTTREGEPATAYGVICGRHWYEYGARCPNCASLEAQNTATALTTTTRTIVMNGTSATQTIKAGWSPSTPTHPAASGEG